MKSKIIGMGYYAPKKIYDNFKMQEFVETDDEWITQRTGIKKRHISDFDEYTTDLATIAAKNALKNAGISAEELDLIIFSTVTPDCFTPSCSCIVQARIGADNSSAFDINAACSGFVTGSVIANQFIKTGSYKTIMVIGADALSKATDYTDRSTCILFGDAAGAVIYRASESGGIIETDIGAKGKDGDKLTSFAYRVDEEEIEKRVSKNKNHIWMAGKEVMKFAVTAMSSSALKVCENAGLSMDDIKLIIPHQANQRIIDSAAKRMNIDKEKIFVNLSEYGNTSSASIPVAMCEAAEQGLIKRGDKFIIVGFGGGLTWGSALIEY